MYISLSDGPPQPSDPLQKDEIDAELVKSLRYLGWGATDDEISTSLLSPEYNIFKIIILSLSLSLRKSI
jgi:hypothetical protein